MPREGFIKDYRQELESDIWVMPPLYHRVWQWLKYEVNHTENEIPMKDGSKFLVNKGQRLTSYRGISKAIGWYEGLQWKEPNPKTIKTICDWLEKNNMIIQEHGKGNRQYTLITIVNWDIYQAKKEEGVTVNKQKSNTKITEKKQVADINKNEKNEKNENNIFLPDSNEYRLADYLRKFILKNNPNAKVPDDKKLQSWCKTMDLILRVDERSVDEIKDHIKFSQTDTFWMNNILSPTSLRKQYDKLTLKIKGGDSSGQHSFNNQQNKNDNKGKWSGFKIQQEPVGEEDYSGLL